MVGPPYFFKNKSLIHLFAIASNSGSTSGHNEASSDTNDDLKEVSTSSQETTQVDDVPKTMIPRAGSKSLVVSKAELYAAYPNGIPLSTRPPKSAKVIEKERQMKFLLESFPKVDAMVSKFYSPTSLLSQSHTHVCDATILNTIQCTSL